VTEYPIHEAAWPRGGHRYHPDNDSVPDPGPAALRAGGLFGRQVMRDGLEEFLGHAGAGHGGDLLGRGIYRPKAQTS